MMELIIGGDLVHNAMLERLCSDSYNESFAHVKDVISQADYSIVNLEAPIISGPVTPIPKSGPNLHCSSKVADLIKWLGFNCVTLANNHFYDQGENGVYETLACLKTNNIEYVGGGKNLDEASKTLFVNIKNCRIAIISCCEKEYSIASNNSGGSNLSDPVRQYYAIKEAKNKADYIIVINHGGMEHFQYPSVEMQRLFRFFVDAGANVVVNHHQHCFSGYELYKSAPIFYGLGNFCFPMEKFKNHLWNYGYLVSLKFDNHIDYRLIPYKQCNGNIAIELLNDREKKEFEHSVEQINNIIADESELAIKNTEFMNKTESNYDWLFCPFDNKYYRALVRRGLLPGAVSRKKIDEFLSLINCDSHRLRLVSYLNNRTTKHHV